MKLITRDDFTDVYLKTIQRGSSFILSKLNPSALSRTKSAFDNSSIQNSNWWIIPLVRERWNLKITGDSSLEYEEYTVNKYLKNKENLRMLSIGSGVCSHELKFAQHNNFKEIICLDIASNLLEKAAQEANKLDLQNIKFWEKDIYKMDFNKGEFDIIMFHSSLHHFSNIPNLISNKIKTWMKSNGLLLINEYVGKNRLQFSKTQLLHINQGLKMIPKKLKKRFKTSLTKNRFYGSGYLRMIIADPSECIESEQILPVLHKAFDIVEEKPYGGNLLMNILKDISHNFLDSQNEEVKSTLSSLFKFEDDFLQTNKSDFIFGIYKKSR